MTIEEQEIAEQERKERKALKDEVLSDYGEETTRAKPKSYEVTYEYAQDKVDTIAKNRLTVTKSAQNVRNRFIRDSEENAKAVIDYIFGISEENPLQEVTDAEYEKYAAYDAKIEELGLSVRNHAKAKKLNQ